MHRPMVDLLIWLRVPGDTIFAIGTPALTLFVIGLWLFPRREGEVREEAAAGPARDEGAWARREGAE